MSTDTPELFSYAGHCPGTEPEPRTEREPHREKVPIMGGAEDLIYGARNGESYTVQSYKEEGVPDGEPRQETFWAEHVVVNSHLEFGDGVSLRMARADQKTGLPDEESWVGTTLSFDGCNRLIRAIRKHRDRQFGTPE